MVDVLHSEIQANEENWNFIIVGYVMGAKPYYAHLLSFATRSWNPSSLKLFSRDNGYFFLN